MKALLLILLAASLLALYLSRQRAEDDQRLCEHNLYNLAIGLEMYSSDAAGRYPRTLDAAVRRDHLKIPTCPAAGYDTYSASYQSTVTPDTFTLSCQGYHHGALQLSYTAEEGLTRTTAR